MELRVLGPIEVRHDGSAVGVRGTKPRQLLALLAIRPNHPVAADKLVDELWQGNPPPSAATALRVHIGRLRQVLELDRHRHAPSTRLPAGRNGYVLRIEPDELDAQRFERLVLLAREVSASGDPERAVPQLTAALDLWRGEALHDIADLPTARAEIARLDDLRGIAFEDLADARLMLGEHALVVDLARAALVRYPLRERLTASLMLALYRSGRQAEALQAYAYLAHRLDSELGVAPSHELRRIEEAVLLQRPSLDAGARRAGPPTPLGRGPIGRFVGRRTELSSLLHAVESSREKGIRLIVVAGEAGIGKTTLLEEFCTRAQQCGVRPLVGHCTPDSSSSYQPIIEILRQVVQTIDSEARAALPAELGLVIADVVDPGRDAQASTDGKQYRLFEAIVATLRQHCTPPRFLIVEDLHWADRPTLRVLRHVARHQTLDSTTVIATLRDDDIDGQRADTIDHLARSSERVRLNLSGFDDHEVRALIRATAPPETLSSLIQLSSNLRDVTQGNPFFLRELLREIDEECIKLGGDLWETLSTIAPAGVRALVDRRLARLTSAARMIVDAASVFGHDIEASLLAHICGMSRGTALEGLEEALASRLLVEDYQQVDHYWFAHALVRNAIYAAIPDDARRELHRRAAYALEGASSCSPSTSCVELAHHYREAAPLGLHNAAALHAERAGREATARAAFGEGASWFGQAVELHDAAGTPIDSLGQLYLAYGRALISDKQHAQALAALWVAADSARRTRDYVLLADVALTADNPWALGADYQPDALALLEEALALVGASEPALRVRLLGAIATNLYYIDAEREGDAARAALKLAEEIGGTIELATAHRAMHLWHTHQPEAHHDRLASGRRAYGLACSAGPDAGKLRLETRRALLVDLLECQEISEFESVLDAYEADADELGSPADIYWAMALRAMQTAMHGDLTAAHQLARGALLRGHELDQISDGAYFLQRFVIRYQQARLAEEIPALAAAGNAESVYRAGAALHALGLCETGQAERALRVTRRILGADATGLRRDAFWLAGMSLFAGIARTVGDVDLAAQLQPLLEPCAEHVVLFGAGAAMLGSGHQWLGGLKATLGDQAAALTHYDAAATIAQRVQAPYWEAQAKIDAAFLLRHNSTASSEAHRLHNEAVAIAASRGYQRIMNQADALL